MTSLFSCLMQPMQSSHRYYNKNNKYERVVKLNGRYFFVSHEIRYDRENLYCWSDKFEAICKKYVRKHKKTNAEITHEDVMAFFNDPRNNPIMFDKLFWDNIDFLDDVIVLRNDGNY